MKIFLLFTEARFSLNVYGTGPMPNNNIMANDVASSFVSERTRKGDTYIKAVINYAWIEH